MVTEFSQTSSLHVHPMLLISVSNAHLHEFLGVPLSHLHYQFKGKDFLIVLPIGFLSVYLIQCLNLLLTSWFAGICYVLSKSHIVILAFHNSPISLRAWRLFLPADSQHPAITPDLESFQLITPPPFLVYYFNNVYRAQHLELLSHYSHKTFFLLSHLIM